MLFILDSYIALLLLIDIEEELDLLFENQLNAIEEEYCSIKPTL
jgi:hypothetical protein